MSNVGIHYNVLLTASGMNQATQFTVTLTSEYSLFVAGISLVPSDASLVYVYAGALVLMQVGMSLGNVMAGASISTSESSITGNVTIDPPINVVTTIELYGGSHPPLAQSTFDAGSAGGNFNFPISGNGAADAQTAGQLLAEKLKVH